MRTNFVAIAATLLVSTAFAVPVAPVSGDAFNNLKTEATITIKQEGVPVVDLTPAASSQDAPQWQPPPPNSWSGSRPAGSSGWGQDSTASQPNGWGTGSFGPPPAPLPPSSSSSTGGSWFGNRPASTPSPTSNTGGGWFGGSKPDAVSPSPTSGGWFGGSKPDAAPKPSSSSTGGWGFFGNAPAPSPTPTPQPEPNWTGPVGGYPPGSRPNSPPSGGNGWGQAPAPVPASGSSWGQAPAPPAPVPAVPASGPSWGQAQPAPAPAPPPPNIGPATWGQQAPKGQGGSPTWAGSSGQGQDGGGNRGQNGSQPRPPIPTVTVTGQPAPPVQWPGAPREDGWKEVGQGGGPF